MFSQCNRGNSHGSRTWVARLHAADEARSTDRNCNSRDPDDSVRYPWLARRTRRPGTRRFWIRRGPRSSRGLRRCGRGDHRPRPPPCNRCRLRTVEPAALGLVARGHHCRNPARPPRTHPQFHPGSLVDHPGLPPCGPEELHAATDGNVKDLPKKGLRVLPPRITLACVATGDVTVTLACVR